MHRLTHNVLIEATSEPLQNLSRERGALSVMGSPGSSARSAGAALAAEPGRCFHTNMLSNERYALPNVLCYCLVETAA